MSHYTSAAVAALVVSGGTYTMVNEAAPAARPMALVPAPVQEAGPSSTAATPVPGRRPRQTRPATTPTRPPGAALSAPTTTLPTSSPPLPPSSECTIENRWHRDVAPRVRQVACMLHERFPGVVDLLGVGPGSVAHSDHPRGLAVDVVINHDRVTGDAIAACAAQHFTDWGLDYILWRQASLEDAGGAFEPMANRGSPTANHYNHVHLSFLTRDEPIPDDELTCDNVTSREERP